MPEDKQTKIVKLPGKHGVSTWELPEVLYFDLGHGIQSGHYFYRVLGYRRPKAGEDYLSGAIPQSWRASVDLLGDYLVVKPTHKAIRVSRWARGERV